MIVLGAEHKLFFFFFSGQKDFRSWAIVHKTYICIKPLRGTALHRIQPWLFYNVRVQGILGMYNSPSRDFVDSLHVLFKVKIRNSLVAVATDCKKDKWLKKLNTF